MLTKKGQGDSFSVSTHYNVIQLCIGKFEFRQSTVMLNK